MLFRIRFLYALALFFLVASCGISKSLKDLPDLSTYDSNIPERIRLSDSSFVVGNNSLTKNKQGLWELYIQGDPLQRGLLTGSLTQELLQNQEKIFLSKIDELVPSKTKQSFLRKFLAWYNRKMYLHVTEEYKSEIYGVSRYSSEVYNHIANQYLRALYLHGAHDIGHALQDLALVGCSSFAAWGDKTEDGSLIIGRNFDFYAGDDFAKEKIIAFVHPTQGHKFMSVTWGGMIGVLSGMNDQGLTVTINAGKSKIPLIAKTPISLLTREILQYASTIEEAYAIAKKRKVFVSESIFVGSARDKKAIIIEVSPKNIDVYEVANSNQLICSNHFQSDAYVTDKNNLKHIKESHSQYRYERMTELLQDYKKMTPKSAAAILRNKDGLDDKKIGYGNEKALNQLLAHHAIIFKPEQRLVWVSSNPYQLGEFVAYNLDDVFKNDLKNPMTTSLSIAELTIEKDPFQYTEEYKKYEKYRLLMNKVQTAIASKKHVNLWVLKELQDANPEYWKVYAVTGQYHYEKKAYVAALGAFKKARTKEITTLPDMNMIDTYIKKTKRKLK